MSVSEKGQTIAQDTAEASDIMDSLLEPEVHLQSIICRRGDGSKKDVSAYPITWRIQNAWSSAYIKGSGEPS